MNSKVKSTASPVTKLFRFSILFLFLIGVQAWFTWNIKETITYGLIFLISALYQKERKIKFNLSKTAKIGFFLMFCAWEFINRSWAVFAAVMFLLRFYPLVVLYQDPKMKQTVQFVLSGFAVLLIPSICVYIISPILPKGPIIANDATDVYKFYNYLFLIIRTDGIDRFGAFCLEPSYLGTACAFILYLTRYNLKLWFNKIYLLALILSFSLAGIGIAIIGYFIVTLRTIKAIGTVIAISIFLMLSANFFQYYNGGDNVINEKIVSRLQFDEKKGISGNNRVSWTTDMYFASLLLSGERWYGLGKETIDYINGGSTGHGDFGSQIRGAGFKIFILYNGLIGVILCIGFYGFLAADCPSNNQRFSWGFFTLIVVTAVQAAYPFSYSWLIPFLCGIKIPEIRKGVSVLSDKYNENFIYCTYHRLARK